MDEEILGQIGLSKNEAKVYIALLDLGSATAGQIAEKSKVHRTNVYDSLERLVEKGMVSFVFVDKTKYFQATDPENLFRIIKEKENILKKAIPELKLRIQLSEKKSEARIFQGAKAFMDILYNFLNYKQPILVYGIPKKAPEILKTYIPHFHKKRIPRKIVMKHIYNHNAQERIKYLNSLPCTEARFLPEKFDSHCSTNICGDEVVLSLWVKPPIIIQIKNKDIANCYKRYFEILWKNAKK